MQSQYSTSVKFLFFVLIAISAAEAQPEEGRCMCSDVDPRETHDGPPQEFPCFEQQQFGKCEESYMLNTIAELPEGYCQITCGRCVCCSTLQSLSENNGLTEFVLAMEAAELGSLLENPGWMVTLLASTNSALRDWLESRGTTWEDLVLDSGLLKELKETMRLHVVLPLASINALWTKPFFFDGTKLTTLSESYPEIEVSSNDGQISFSGPQNSVKLLNGEREACKGFVYTVDGVFQTDSQRQSFDRNPSVQG